MGHQACGAEAKAAAACGDLAERGLDFSRRLSHDRSGAVPGKTWERLGRLEEARAMVVTSPEVLGGTPVIRGTRVPVYDVAASTAAAMPVDRILAAYPSLDADKVELAAIYAEANPPRGRPRHSPELPKGATVIADRQMSRRRKAE